ncbi:hypothetical protein H1P_40007 [Hyella patelloides LEGE 07179]|uniref:Uncharacterized protein n=1 Tax=Hyella patelloides LEGE 07179 TaxID=945734 RepID=A0A563VX89_9CYAN|nr:hypothetical protein H1P_40007 [Hyella patelloides LEGE 07179]
MQFKCALAYLFSYLSIVIYKFIVFFCFNRRIYGFLTKQFNYFCITTRLD